jgi:hypothetical protein
MVNFVISWQLYDHWTSALVSSMISLISFYSLISFNPISWQLYDHWTSSESFYMQQKAQLRDGKLGAILLIIVLYSTILTCPSFLLYLNTLSGQFTIAFVMLLQGLDVNLLDDWLPPPQPQTRGCFLWISKLLSSFIFVTGMIGENRLNWWTTELDN